jgi:hypothetical protein
VRETSYASFWGAVLWQTLTKQPTIQFEANGRSSLTIFVVWLTTLPTIRLNSNLTTPLRTGYDLSPETITHFSKMKITESLLL